MIIATNIALGLLAFLYAVCAVFMEPKEVRRRSTIATAIVLAIIATVNIAAM